LKRLGACVRVFGIVANEINIINNLFHPHCVSDLQLKARRCLINDLGVPAREPTNMITKEEGSNLSSSATNEDPDTMLLRLGFLSAANCLFCMFLAKQLAAVDLLSHQCLLGPRAKVHHWGHFSFLCTRREQTCKNSLAPPKFIITSRLVERPSAVVSETGAAAFEARALPSRM
jgi:hypothetical protein